MSRSTRSFQRRIDYRLGCDGVFKKLRCSSGHMGGIGNGNASIMMAIIACFFNFADTQDGDLDALLGELCALESQYKEAASASARNSSNGKFQW